jgi:spore maturation protein CgeB
MRILIVGSNKIFSIENFYVKYLAQGGVSISVFLAPNIFNDYYQQGIINRVMFRAGISSIYKKINNRFREMVERESPDLIWVFKGMELFPESLEWARQRKVKLVNYNPDNPFFFSGRGSGNKNISKAIGLYDLHFTYNLEIKKKIDKEFHTKTCYLPFGFEIEDSLYDHCVVLPEIVEACFLGNPDAFRSAFITKLAGAGVQMTVFGHDWNRFVDHPKIKIQNAVYGRQQWEVLRRYRVQLNLMRPHNKNSHNMRTFEVPGIGGIMVAPDTVEHRMFFEDSKEIFLFQNTAQCVEKIKWLLGLPEYEADEIRVRARDRSLKSKYSYRDRSMQVDAELQKLIAR